MVIYVVCVVLAVFAVGFILGSLYEKDRMVGVDEFWWWDGYEQGREEAHASMPRPCCKPSPIPSVFDQEAQ